MPSALPSLFAVSVWFRLPALAAQSHPLAFCLPNSLVFRQPTVSYIDFDAVLGPLHHQCPRPALPCAAGPSVRLAPQCRCHCIPSLYTQQTCTHACKDSLTSGLRLGELCKGNVAARLCGAGGCPRCLTPGSRWPWRRVCLVLSTMGSTRTSKNCTLEEEQAMDARHPCKKHSAGGPQALTFSSNSRNTRSQAWLRASSLGGSGKPMCARFSTPWQQVGCGRQGRGRLGRLVQVAHRWVGRAWRDPGQPHTGTELPAAPRSVILCPAGRCSSSPPGRR